MKHLALGILVLSLVAGSAELRGGDLPQGVLPPSTNQPPTGLSILAGWDASPDPTVVGYYIGWGLATGQCTNLIEVGNVTEVTLSGLSTNVLYHFTVVAHDAAGQQAPPSNEVQFMGSNSPALTPPSLLADLTNQAAVAGSAVVLSVEASGSDPMSYQWLFNGSPLSASSNTLSLPQVTVQQGGQYQVMVTNAAGSVTSAVATLTVLVPPMITADLVSQTVRVGTNVTFTLGVSGPGPLNYQWFFNGSPLSASANTLSLPGVTVQQGGQYQVVVTNAAGAVTSAVATLSVLVPPTLTSDLVSQRVCAGSNVTFQVGVSGTSPFGYQWLCNGTNLPGGNANSLSFDNVGQQLSGTYQVLVSNVAGSVSSSLATLTVLIPPSFLVDITNQTVSANTNVTFRVSVAGTSPLSYQWFFNGSAMLGATTNSLTVKRVSSSKTGIYQVIVSNTVGVASSQAAQLSILSAPTITSNPTNVTAKKKSSATFAAVVSGASPMTYQWLFDGTNLAGATANPLILTNIDVTQAGTYQVIVSNSMGTAISSPATLAVALPPAIVTDLTNLVTVSGSNITLQIQATGTGPLAYEWHFNGNPVPGAATNSLTLAPATSANAGSYQVIVTNAYGTAQSAVAALQINGVRSLGISTINNDTFSLSFGGVPGQSYTVQYSINLSNWLDAGTATADASGNAVFTTNRTAASAFFRVSTQ